jgi:hypothetical protein
MPDNEISKLTETVPSALLEDDSVRVYIVEGEKVISEYETPVAINNPYTFDPSHFLPNTKLMNLPRFFKIASDLIADAQGKEGITDVIPLVEEYPPELFHKFGDEVIAYRVLRREPAKMNAKGTGRPHRKHTHYYSVISPDLPNKAIVIDSRPVDHTIEFTCWAKSNKLANARALWLEKLFVNHSWVFTVQGVERFFWKDRGPDTYMTSGGQRLFYRPVNFFMRLREFEIKATSLVREIHLHYGLADAYDLKSLTLDPYLIKTNFNTT